MVLRLRGVGVKIFGFGELGLQARPGQRDGLLRFIITRMRLHLGGRQGRLFRNMLK